MNARDIQGIAHSRGAIAYGIARYVDRELALTAAYAGEKIRLVVVGDDNRYWVMCPKFAQMLESIGYTIVNR